LFVLVKSENLPEFLWIYLTQRRRDAESKSVFACLFHVPYK
jgi:hypothetical protein